MILLYLFFGKGCSNTPGDSRTEIIDSLMKVNTVLKAEVDSLLAVKANIKDSVRIKDSIRVKWQKRWIDVKDSLKVPAECDSIVNVVIQVCDSVLAADSELIAEQKAEIAVSDTIIKRQAQAIENQDQVIENKDAEIVDLKKEVRRQKRQKFIAWCVAALSTAAAIFK